MNGKRWYYFSNGKAGNVIYVVSADDLGQVRKELASITQDVEIKPLSWGELKYLLGSSIPVNENLEDQVSGNVVLSQDRRIIVIWPL